MLGTTAIFLQCVPFLIHVLFFPLWLVIYLRTRLEDADIHCQDKAHEDAFINIYAMLDKMS